VPTDEKFTVVLRGYDKYAVDAMRQRVEEALAGNRPEVKAAVRDAVRRASFVVAFRGYDRPQVDDWFSRALNELG
jgi:hypothetical protein